MAWYSARYLGGRNPYSWDPEDQSLGGSEQAVVELSSAWAVRGLTVAVYGQFSPSRIYRNVIYRDARTFRGDLQYKNLIIWGDIENRERAKAMMREPWFLIVLYGF